ncbi:MAG: flagellar hook basal-body protein, partial [Candidatus Zixiibacteriota bacterium]
MIPQIRRQDLLANNIANASTTGFKKDMLFTRELSRVEARHRRTKEDWQTDLDTKIAVDFTPGVFDHTENPLDMAIDGDGFFVLQSPDGETLLTRSGAFEVDANGFLSAPGGFTVRGQGGPIQIGSGQVSVSRNGEVQVNGETVDRIVPMTVADLTQLERRGGATFAVPNGTELIATPNSEVLQGYVERGNVDMVTEMVDMIVT